MAYQPPKKWKQATRAIHLGENPDHEYGSVSTPIYQTSAFEFESTQQGADRFAGKESGYIYTRMGNPTIAQFEEKIAGLENGVGALATASGMAAVSTVYFSLLGQGDHMIGSDALYGLSRVIVEKEFSRFGVKSDFVDTSNLGNIREKIRPETRLLFIETPTNPTIAVTDIAGCAQIAKEHDITLVVDNTFLTPIFQRPLELGADIVIHSVTKFINGHTDLVGGIIVSSTQEMHQRFRSMLNLLGGTMDPHQAWMGLRGSKTLGLRLRKAAENADVLAQRLEAHPKVRRVLYPGLASHPQHELSKKQTEGHGALLCFELKDGYPAGEKLLNSLELCLLAVSLGGVETLIQHPASMTHASMEKSQRIAAGITGGLVRMSVGCEDVEDLWEDLEQGLRSL